MKYGWFTELPLDAFTHVGDRKIRLHGAVQAVSDAVSNVGSAVVGTASDVINNAVSSVSDVVNDVGTAVAQSPILNTAVGAALIANGVPPAAAAALLTANKGGTPEQIATSAGVAGLLSGALAPSSEAVSTPIPTPSVTGTELPPLPVETAVPSPVYTPATPVATPLPPLSTESLLPSITTSLPQLPVIDTTAATQAPTSSIYDLTSNTGTNVGIQATPGTGTNLFGNTVNEGFQLPTAPNLDTMSGGQGLLGTAAGTAGTAIGETGLNYNPLPVTNPITGQPLGQTLNEINTGVTDVTGATAASSNAFQNQLLKKLLGSIMANDTTSSAIGSGLLGGAGSLIQGQVSKEAAQALADRMAAATGSAVSGSQFRPVGITSRFGQSNFQINPETGAIESAGYTPTALSNRLQQGAESVYNLGTGYIAQSPQEAAQQWLSSQQALLAPSRDVALANLRNQTFQRGREGLSIAQGGDLAAANPELAAYYNSLANQNALLASQAQQFGQQQAQFGTGLLGSGLGLMGGVESLAQQPFTLGTGLGQQAATAGANAGRLGIAGQQAGQNYLYNAMTYNPYASLLSGGSTSPLLSTTTGNLVNSLFGGPLSSWISGLGSSPATNFTPGSANAALADLFAQQTGEFPF
jgi:hypothetical protein